MRFTLASAVVAASYAAAQTTHTIMVGQNSTLTYNPPNITANAGDIVTFVFTSKNHTVTQSSFPEPCTQLTNTSVTPNVVGISSGFVPVAANSSTFPTWSFSLTDTNPLWFFCLQSNPANHCQAGMVFSINATPQKPYDQFLAAAKYRRSVYALKDTSHVPDSRIEQIIQEVASFAPSSYNTQPGRFTIVLGEKHKQLWDAVIEQVEPILKGAGPGVWDAMGPRFQMFKNSYGSVLFWDRGQSIKDAQETHKAAAHMFPQFADHASGIAQGLVWTALEIEGFGANLQHMGAIPPAEIAIRKFLSISDDWSLKANLNFGEKAQPHPEIPEKLPLSELVTLVK